MEMKLGLLLGLLEGTHSSEALSQTCNENIEESAFAPLLNAGLGLAEWCRETVLRDGPVWGVVLKLKHLRASLRASLRSVNSLVVT